MNQTITISAKSMSKQLNELQLRNYYPHDSDRVTVTGPNTLVPVIGVLREDDNFVESIEEYRQQVDVLEKL